MDKNPREMKMLTKEIKIVAIGVSTGGPAILQKILSSLGDEFPPILIVQHISPGFLVMMTDLLKQQTKRNIIIPHQGEPIKQGCIYMAPDSFHMGVTVQHCIDLSNADPENGIRPAISYLLRSVNKVFGAQSLGILLTGMGHDGVTELKKMKESGAMTVVQDKASSVVHGMAGDAITKQAVDRVMTPEQITELLKSLSKRSHG